MVTKKHKEEARTLTTKMPGETEQQYLAWLLYLEEGSLEKTLKAWKESWYQNDANVVPVSDFQLGKVVAISTIKRWSRKYCWVERTELQLEEELLQLKNKTNKFRLGRKYFLTDILMKKVNKLRKTANRSEATVLEVKHLWEMHRTEWDETSGKSDVSHHINEDEQRWPTEEEAEIDRVVGKALKEHYEKKRKKRSSK